MGAGSIGSVIGGFLHLGGHDVYLVGKGPHIEAMSSGGLEISGIWGSHEVRRIKAASSIEKVAADGFEPEWTLMSVKSYDTHRALEDMADLIPGQRGIASLQNGLGNVEEIADAAPGKAVGGRVIFGASTLRPGAVEVTVCADDVLMGPAFGGPAGVEEVCEALDSSGIPCRYEEKILSYIWDKVLYNVALNPLATVLRTNYGSLGDDAGTRSVIESLIREFYEVAAVEGVELVAPTAEAYVERFFSDLLPPTREHRSSMQEDIENRRPTEISALNGAVCRMAEEKGIEVPANRLLTTLVEFLERRATDG